MKLLRNQVHFYLQLPYLNKLFLFDKTNIIAIHLKSGAQTQRLKYIRYWVRRNPPSTLKAFRPFRKIRCLKNLKSMKWGEKPNTRNWKAVRQADGTVIATLGETSVMANVTFAKEMKEGQDFFL